MTSLDKPLVQAQINFHSNSFVLLEENEFCVHLNGSGKEKRDCLLPSVSHVTKCDKIFLETRYRFSRESIERFTQNTPLR